MPYRRKTHRQPLTGWIAALSLILAVLVIMAASLPPVPPNGAPETTGPQLQATTEATQSTVPPTTAAPTDPPVTLESTFTLSATGDILMHKPVINTAPVTDGEYDFASIFSYFADYVTGADYAVANLETTLASTNNGYAYSGYPRFNCPDGIVTGLKNAGFDMLLTANNHSYDTVGAGLRRTQQVIADRGLVNLGSKLTADAPNYLVVERNGIRIGMSCYTYEDNAAADKKAPNGIPMAAADAPLLNTFDYSNLSLFYAEMKENIAKMRQAGANSILLFIHWGNEYQLTPNTTQTAMAQALCDLGVDVIIGGHPHVIQPVELLTSTDGSRKTVCLYSMGNAVSNQRVSQMNLKTGHTEDGLLFSVTFTKYSDGTVILSKADVLPTWVDLRTSPQKAYPILPLDKQVEDWKAQFGLTDATLAKAQKSYDRTMAIVGEGLTAVNAYLAALRQQTETALGVQ